MKSVFNIIFKGKTQYLYSSLHMRKVNTAARNFSQRMNFTELTDCTAKLVAIY